MLAAASSVGALLLAGERGHHAGRAGPRAIVLTPATAHPPLPSAQVRHARLLAAAGPAFPPSRHLLLLHELLLLCAGLVGVLVYRSGLRAVLVAATRPTLGLTGRAASSASSGTTLSILARSPRASVAHHGSGSGNYMSVIALILALAALHRLASAGVYLHLLPRIRAVPSAGGPAGGVGSVRPAGIAISTVVIALRQSPAVPAAPDFLHTLPSAPLPLCPWLTSAANWTGRVGSPRGTNLPTVVSLSSHSMASDSIPVPAAATAAAVEGRGILLHRRRAASVTAHLQCRNQWSSGCPSPKACPLAQPCAWYISLKSFLR